MSATSRHAIARRRHIAGLIQNTVQAESRVLAWRRRWGADAQAVSRWWARQDRRDTRRFWRHRQRNCGEDDLEVA